MTSTRPSHSLNRPFPAWTAGPVTEDTGTASDGTTEKPLRVEYDLTVVGGESGHRLAALQAAAILDVLTWFHEQATGTDLVIGSRRPRP
jgi:hypothetical protein